MGSGRGIPNTMPGPVQADDLQSIVLRWSIDDITNSKLFKKQVGTIPDEFSSVVQYTQGFRVPLLEEIRAQLHQALEKSMNLEFSLPVQNSSRSRRVLPVKITQIIRTGRKEEQSLKKLLFMDINSRIQASDLILLCSKAPKWNSKRECMIQTQKSQYILASVNDAREDSPIITATVYVQHENSILEKMSSWHAVLLGTTLIPAQRIWDSLQEAILPKKELSQMSVIQSILRIKQQSVPAGISTLLLPQAPEHALTLQHVEAYCNYRSLNISQAEALRSALAGLLIQETNPHVRMVQGPPGTGKTAMLVTMLSVLGCLHCRTLVSAPTNAAVLEVCKRMMTFFKVSSEEEQQKLFYGYCAGNTEVQSDNKSSRCWPLELSEVILVGSEERMEETISGTLLENVFLPYRVNRLLAALTGWKGSVQSVVRFLKDAPGQYKAMKQKLEAQAAQGEQGPSNKKTKPPNTSAAKDKKGKKKQQKILADDASFWRFAKDSMVKMQAQMQKDSFVLTSELPRCHLDLQTSKAMSAVCDLMKNLVNSMPLKAPLAAKSWFKTSTGDGITEEFANLKLADRNRPDVLKSKFAQGKKRLLNALKAQPGGTLLKSETEARILTFGWLRSQCFNNATLVFSTVSSAGGPLMKGASFKCAIIDEASQLVEAETTIITTMRGLEQLILVGDHKQLPATVISKVAGKCGYGRSLFDRLQTLQHGCRHLLNMQYRMTPAISKFPNSRFYNDGVKDGPNVLSPDYGKSLYQSTQYGAYAFLDCKDGVEVPDKKSWTNPIEVELVKSLVKLLENVRNIKKLSVGVISPYSVQVEAVKQSLGIENNPNELIDIQVKTVDGFQGNERDVIIFTAVRSNHTNQIGFVENCRRLNVAISRGRHCLWIVGNARTLSGGGKVWKKLIRDSQSRNCFYTATLASTHEME